ncbi:MAG: hypoxanthine phosphoribosyltransferase [Deltaproteobacteria bacterium]|nr:hypoxanthine phosphoribosyltransferase [Deltaproteobacteria bacterium]MBW2067468.1 hypoxanthine phosphoribosyltransferase [Deltaproteobacteria bacterium]
MKEYDLKQVIDEQSIRSRVKELARTIEADMRYCEDVVIIGILKGAFIFMADLVRHFSFPMQIDFIRIASYGTGHTSSGEIRVTKDIEVDIEGKHVLLIEDIVDTGLSLKWVMDYLKKRKPASLKVCVFIDKKERRECEVSVDYVGFEVQEGFLVGYGLDYSERHRELPGVYEVRFRNG